MDNNIINNEKMMVRRIKDNAEIRIYFNPEITNENEIINKLNNYDSLLAENEKLKRLLEDLTPGGSEFVNDPKYCFDFVKKEINSIPSQILPFKKRSEKLLSVLKRISDAHDCYAPNYGMTDGIFKEVEEAIIGGTLPPIN